MAQEITEMIEALDSEIRINPDSFTDWEFDFVVDIAQRLEERGNTSSFTGKQVDKIEQLYRKHIG